MACALRPRSQTKSKPKDGSVKVTVEDETAGPSLKCGFTALPLDPVNVMIPATPPNTDSDDENDQSVVLVEKLLGNGISDSDIHRLKKAGIFTVNSVAITLKRKLLQIPGISEMKADLILKRAHGMINLGITTATDFFQKQNAILKITTGVRSVDALLNGGVQLGQILEIWGKSNTGKTQFALTLAVTSQLPVDKGGANSKCFLIDTEKKFCSSRLIEIAERFKLDPSTVLDNVYVARAHTTDHLMQLLLKARAIMLEERFGILIVDSAIHLFRTSYFGRGELFDRQTKLGQFLRELRKIADEHKVAVLLCNQAVSVVTGNPLSGADAKATGGYIFSHASETRLQFRKAPGGPNRYCRIENSPCLAEGEAIFAITKGGVDDVTV